MVLSWIWTGLVALSVLCGTLTGTLGSLSAAAMDGAAAGVTLCLSMAGALCLWSGLCRVLSGGGVLAALARFLRPLLRRLYPESCRDADALDSICANLSANLLGLGNAATPPGIDAVKRMRTRASGSAATDEMCRLIVMNTASVQLIPSTVAAARAACGASAPFDILPAVWITSLCSVSAGLAAAFLLQKVFP